MKFAYFINTKLNFEFNLVFDKFIMILIKIKIFELNYLFLFYKVKYFRIKYSGLKFDRECKLF